MGKMKEGSKEHKEALKKVEKLKEVVETKKAEAKKAVKEEKKEQEKLQNEEKELKTLKNKMSKMKEGSAEVHSGVVTGAGLCSVILAGRSSGSISRLTASMPPNNAIKTKTRGAFMIDALRAARFPIFADIR